MPIPSPIAWTATHGVRILDQTRLPGEECYLDLDTVEGVAEAIRTLRVRGAPLIGIAAAMGVVQAAGRRGSGEAGKGKIADLDQACQVLAATRPTAVNLEWALNRMRKRATQALEDNEPLRDALIAEASAIWDEDRA
ncbi:MAG TPA: hypothetical protein VFU40_08695, partial [Gemmatimonadales bacterium]|nr:hypothetical protein [Gemmatimonadales bacterium]